VESRLGAGRVDEESREASGRASSEKYGRRPEGNAVGFIAAGEKRKSWPVGGGPHSLIRGTIQGTVKVAVPPWPWSP